MGGTLDKIYNNTCYSLYLNSKAISVLEEQSSTGSRVNRASDDPSSAYQILGLQSQTTKLENYMSIIDSVTSTLEMTSTVLSSMSSLLSDVETSLTQLISGTYNDDDRDSLITSINSSLEEMVSYANTKNLGKYLFSGASTTTAAYTIEYDSEDVISDVTYTGSSDELTVEVASGVTTTSYYVGTDLFSCDDRSTPTFYGSTGLTAGTGTSSITGTAWLEVTEDSVGYNLTIGGNTVNLSTYTGDLSNVALTNEDGEVLYVDATNITGTGTNMVTADGTYDVFSILLDTRDLLENSDDLSDTELQDYLDVMVNMLDDVYNKIVSEETAIGSKTSFLSDLSTTLEDVSYNTEDQTTTLQEADVTQIAIDLARRETLYEMTLTVAGELLSMTLLDYID